MRKLEWLAVGKDDLAFVSGGLNRYFSDFTNALAGSGISVRKVVSGQSSDGDTLTLGNGPVVFRAASAFLFGWAQACKVDVIDVHFALYGVFVLAGARLRWTLSRRRRPNVIVHFHGPWAEESRVSRGDGALRFIGKLAIERTVLRQSDFVIVLSRTFSTKADATARRALLKYVVPPGVAPEWFSVPAFDMEGSSKVELLCVRRLTARMGILQLIRALDSLAFRIDGRPIHLHIVGEGEQVTVIRTLVQQLGRNDAVTLHGRLTDVAIRQLAQRCSVAVVPTTQLEGFGLVVLESYAMGRAVVSTGQGGLRDAMGPWATDPFVFDLARPHTLKRALSTADKMSRDGASASQFVSFAQSNSWGSVVDRTLSILGQFRNDS